MKVKKHDNSPLNEKLRISLCTFRLVDKSVKPLTLEQVKQVERLYLAVSPTYSYTVEINDSIHGHIITLPARCKGFTRLCQGELKSLSRCDFIRWVEFTKESITVGI